MPRRAKWVTGKEASYWLSNYFYLLLHLSLVFLFDNASMQKETHNLKKYEMPLFSLFVTTNAIRYKYIKHITIINHSIFPYCKWVYVYLKNCKNCTVYCQKPEKPLDKWSLQSNGKSVWNPINHSTGDWLKDLLFTTCLVWDPEKIIDCEAVKMAWLRTCIDHKSKTVPGCAATVSGMLVPYSCY